VIIFLHIQKTGGSSFVSILDRNFSCSNCHAYQTRREIFSLADFEFVKMVFPRLRCIVGHNLVDPLRFSVADPFYVTFLREPVDRVISHYQFSVVRGKNKMTFEESLQQHDHLNNWQVKLMAGGENLDKAKRFLERCGFVGLTEHFDLSLHVLERLGPCKLDLHYKRRKVAEDNEIRKSLLGDNRMMELARKHNTLDMELYQFAVNEIFPKLCQKAGINPSDKVTSYEMFTSDLPLKYRLGRFYNKVFFRQICKVRYKFKCTATRDSSGDLLSPLG
jgi:uncharacterized Fe-S cluster-containing radical SAM superfamily protein